VSMGAPMGASMPTPIAPGASSSASMLDTTRSTPRIETPAALPAAEKVLVFDLETRRSAAEVGGWGRIRDMGMALGVVEDATTGEARAYRENQVERLIIDLLSADRVVGFNVKRFDYTVLEAYAGVGTFRRVPTLDLLEEVHRFLGFRVKLASVALATLGCGKSADGLQSLEWVKEGRLDLVEEYCRQDVKVTADLYRFGGKHGYLLYPDKENRYLRVPVSW
jgi:DEAD/DEAH box helicase domain-containing protein